MDFLDGSAQRIILYDIGVIPPEIRRWAAINTDSDAS